MNKQTDKTTESVSTAKVAEPPKKNVRPTAKQLQQITKGGRYAFNPETGAMGLIRQPTKAAVPGAKTGAK